MAVSRGLPLARASAHHRTVTLGELRQLVAAADGMSDDLIVRGNAIPFYLPDLGNQLGSRMMSLALDEHVPDENRAQRRARQHKPRS